MNLLRLSASFEQRLVQRFRGLNHIDIIYQPRPEERALARFSKDGHKRDRARGHPSRRPRKERGLLRMRSESWIRSCDTIGFMESID